ncbi:hypothetical protein ACFE04_003977 [Oxalis oulophora]
MREKDAEKTMVPMFPRLHVSDTDYGKGPRAPPRNKMALYEQLSIPSQKLTIGSSSVASFPTSCGKTLMSANHSNDLQKNVFTPLGNSPAQSCFTEKLPPYGSSGVKFSSKTTSKEWKSSKPSPSLGNIGPLPATPVCNFSNFKDYYPKTDIDEDNHGFTLQPSIVPGNDWESFPRLNLNYPMHIQTTSEKHMKEMGNFDPKSTRYIRSQGLEVEEVSRISPENVDTLGLGPSKLSSNIRTTTPLIRPQATPNELNKSSLTDTRHNLENEKASPHQDKLMESANGMGKENVFDLRNGHCNRPSVGDNNFTLNGSCNDCYEDKSCAPIKVRDSQRHGYDISYSSWVHSRSVSPDVVVGVIGESEYWKLRSTISNQQRVFALQVFELHRLIQVQKIIAGSPRLFLEQNFLVGKLVRTSLKKKFPPENVQELPPVKFKEHLQKSNCSDENVIPKIPLPPMNNKELVTQQPPSYEVKPWCFMPPGNQWLVPVISPSEGLIYKPYAGPCPPPTGLTSSVYSSYPSTNQTPGPGSGDFLSTAYGVPASHKPWGPQYSTPRVKSTNSVPLVDQVGLFSGARARDGEFSAGEVESTKPIQNFGSWSNQTNRIYFGKFQDNELHGNTASRTTGDELQLFPTKPTIHSSDQNAQTTKQSQQVIKVIPHNPRTASESAARIFQSIQEQRKGL